jgi:hypothetical protein
MVQIVAELFRVPQSWCRMQTIEITSPIEARRCRYAQYRGEKARLMERVSETAISHVGHTKVMRILLSFL